MAVTELWLVRHGESVANSAATDAELQGLDRIPIDIRDADVPLSATGQEQAEALGRWVGEHRSALDLFWVSPYLRARETLAIALGDEGPPAVVAVDERLRDRELGILDLLTTHGVARLHPEEAERRLHLGKFYHRPPGGESWADVALRLRSFLRDAADTSGNTALVVAHDAIVMLLLYLLRSDGGGRAARVRGIPHRPQRLGDASGPRRSGLAAGRLLGRHPPPA